MNRLPGLDIARGFTVFIMPAVHVMVFYSQPSVKEGIAGQVAAFLAEGPGAQLFMFLMGVSITFSRRNNVRHALRKSILLLLSGYGLNFFRLVIPYLFGWIPKEFLAELELGHSRSVTIHLLCLGDILQFAAFAGLIVYSVFRLPGYYLYAFNFSILIILFSPAIWDLHSNNFLLNHCLELMGGSPPRIYFPVFPWLVYPMAGLGFGYFLQDDSRRNLPFRISGLMGILFLLISNVISPDSHEIPGFSFYRTAPILTVRHMGWVLVWIWGCWILVKSCPQNFIFEFLAHLSRKITGIYFLQWILICWLLPVVPYHSLGLIPSLILMIIISALVFQSIPTKQKL